MGERIALFIDGGYFSKITDELRFTSKNRKKINYVKLVQCMRQKIPLLRCYYYDSLPYQSSVSFKLSEQSFDNLLKKEGVPETIITKLNNLKDKEYSSERIFVKDVSATITTDEFDNYKSLILKYAKSSSPTKEENARFSKKQIFFKELNMVDNFTVRLGKLEPKGFDEKNNKPIFEQKRVDVYLATDLVLHSTKHLITHAGLLTGDSDFLPAIEIAKSEGVIVTLFHAEKPLRPHHDLMDAVDKRVIIDNNLLNTLVL